MQMSFTVTDPKQAAAVLALLSGGGATAADTGAKKRGRPSKAEVEARAKAEETEADEFEADEETDDEADASDDDLDADENTDDEADDEEDEAPKKKKLHLEKDVIPACKKFQAEHSKEKMAKVLASFKVKSVRDLDAAKYPALLAKLKKG